MRHALLALFFTAACGGGTNIANDGSATRSDCSQWKNANSCQAHAGCVVNSCPDCSGNPSFIDCVGEGTPGAACPAKWLSGCCHLLTTDSACKALGGCYSVYSGTSQFEACYGGKPVCGALQGCSISCPTGYSPSASSNFPSDNPTTDAGAPCGCVESSGCATE
jgi:hypothetical protein